jgi:exopolysaccharide production protein ExoQ
VSRQLAIYAYCALIFWFFYRDRLLRPMTSAALWVPLLWFAIIGTRPVSFWLDPGERPTTVESYQDGSPLDAAGYMILLLLGIGILLKRRIDFAKVAASNKVLVAFFVYCLISIVWSDFAFVSMKRYVKDCGNIVMILVILSETDYVAATRAVLVRYAYLVIPLSIMFIKYQPEIGRYYDPWTWQPMYRGVAGEKNALGATVAFGALFLIWDLVDRRRARREAEKAALAAAPTPAEARAARSPTRLVKAKPKVPDRLAKRTVNVAAPAIPGVPPPMTWLDIGGRLLLFAMTLWLLDKADSSNAQVCLVLGAVIIFFFNRSSLGKQGLVRNLGWYTLLLICAVLFVYLVPGVLEALLESIGEDPTLTGRVDLWTDLLAVPNSDLFGAGYQSFWLGGAIETIWAKYYFKPNQAHNGYIDTYLNLGFVGVTLLFALLISAGARLRRRMLNREPVSVLFFALLAFVIFYNWSEAMFSNLTPAWFMTLLATLTYSQTREEALTPAARWARYKRPTPAGATASARRASAERV